MGDVCSDGIVVSLSARDLGRMTGAASASAISALSRTTNRFQPQPPDRPNIYVPAWKMECMQLAFCHGEMRYTCACEAHKSLFAD